MPKNNVLLTCLILLLSLNVKAQLHVNEFEAIKKEKDIREVIWKDSLTFASFDLTKAKEYPNEDIVILDFRTYHSQRIFKGSASQCIRRSLVRSAMLINTQRGVDDMSTFEFGYQLFYDKYANVGIRLFKPDGRVIELPEEVFQSENNWKLAVPDLQIGDIIEVYLFYAEFNFWSDLTSSKTYSYFFTHEHVCLHQYMEFTLEKGAHIKYRLRNGAPEPLIIDEVENYKGSRMVIEMKEAQARVDDEWGFSRQMSEPNIRFRFYFGKASDKHFEEHMYDPVNTFSGSSSAHIDEATISRINLYDRNMNSFTRKHINKVRNKVSKEISRITYASEREKVIDTFYRMSNKLRLEFGHSYNYIGSYEIVRGMGTILRNNLTPSRWFYAPSQYDGGLENIMNYNDLHFGLMVELEGEEPLFFQGDWINYPNGMLNPLLEGVDAYYVMNDFSKVKAVEKFTLPTSQSTNNVREMHLDLRFDELDLTGKVHYKRGGKRNFGLNFRCGEDSKYNCSYLNKILAYEENITVKGYPGESYIHYENLVDLKRVKDPDMIKYGKMEAKKEFNDYYKNFVLDNVAQDLGELLNTEIEELDSVRVLSTGRARPDDVFAIETGTVFKDVATSLGGNKILRLDWLTEAIPSDTRARESDVNFRYGYNDKVNLRISLDEGITVDGIEDLNIRAESRAGSFTSTASLEDNILSISYSYDLKSGSIPLEEWEQLLILMDAIQDFSSGKLLIKKNR